MTGKGVVFALTVCSIRAWPTLPSPISPTQHCFSENAETATDQSPPWLFHASAVAVTFFQARSANMGFVLFWLHIPAFYQERRLGIEA